MYCQNAANESFLIGGGEGVRDSLVEDVSIAGGTTQNGFWMPQAITIYAIPILAITV